MKISELSRKLSKIDFCMLNTHDPAGQINSRPMSNNGDVEYDGDSWFFSYEDTKKVQDIVKDSSVTLTFTAPPGIHIKRGIIVCVNGKASMIRESDEFDAHWTSGLDRWFPQGADTPRIVLIKVSARTIEFWDGEENGKIELASDAAMRGAV